MSDVNKIVAAVLTHGFVAGSGTRYTREQWVQSYNDFLKDLGGQGSQDEPAGPDISAAKAAIIETLNRVLTRK